MVQGCTIQHPQSRKKGQKVDTDKWREMKRKGGDERTTPQTEIGGGTGQENTTLYRTGSI
jgi:hypothetical protein